MGVGEHGEEDGGHVVGVGNMRRECENGKESMGKWKGSMRKGVGGMRKGSMGGVGNMGMGMWG